MPASFLQAMRSSRAFERDEIDAVATMLDKKRYSETKEKQELQHCKTVLEKRRNELQALLTARSKVIDDMVESESVDDAVLAIVAKRHLRLQKELDRVTARMRSSLDVRDEEAEE